MIAVIRIHGQVNLSAKVRETLDRLRLRRKYACVVFDNPSKIEIGMIQAVRNQVAYGEISEATHKKLVEKRKTNIENFFRLHPARGGMKTKFHYPKGVLGENKEIDKLIGRML